MPHYAPRPSPRLLQISLRLAPHRRPLPPLDPPSYTEIERLARGGHYLPWGACKAADGLMGCSPGCAHRGGGAWDCFAPAWHRPTSMCFFFVDGRTPMQAGSGASPSPRQSVFLHEVLLCVCVCVCACSRKTHSLTHSHQTKPPFAHPQSRQDLLFVSRAIPLLASEAFLFIIPIYHHRFARELSFFHFPSVSREPTGS